MDGTPKLGQELKKLVCTTNVHQPTQYLKHLKARVLFAFHLCRGDFWAVMTSKSKKTC